MTKNMVADLEDREQYIDYLNKEISKYIVHLMTTEMTIQDSQKLKRLLSNHRKI